MAKEIRPQKVFVEYLKRKGRRKEDKLKGIERI